MSTTEQSRLALAFTTDGGQRLSEVRGHLFTPTGKWKYDVSLDYSEIWHRIISQPAREVAENIFGRLEYLSPEDAARMALDRASRRGTSGVSVRDLGDYWTLVVPDPPNGWPIMATGTPQDQ